MYLEKDEFRCFGYQSIVKKPKTFAGVKEYDRSFLNRQERLREKMVFRGLCFGDSLHLHNHSISYSIEHPPRFRAVVSKQ